MSTGACRLQPDKVPAASSTSKITGGSSCLGAADYAEINQEWVRVLWMLFRRSQYTPNAPLMHP